MKTTFLYLALMIFTIGLTAQSHPWEVRFSHQIEAEIAEGKIRPARAATLYSFLGEYYTSCTYSDIPVSWGVDELDLGGLETDDALPYIVEAAKDHQVVIISENINDHNIGYLLQRLSPNWQIKDLNILDLKLLAITTTE